VRLDGAAVHLDNRPSDGEPQAQPCKRPRRRTLLFESGQDAGQLPGLYPHAAVVNLSDHGVIVQAAADTPPWAVNLMAFFRRFQNTC